MKERKGVYFLNETSFIFGFICINCVFSLSEVRIGTPITLDVLVCFLSTSLAFVQSRQRQIERQANAVCYQK